MENISTYWDQVIVDQSKYANLLWRDYSNLVNEAFIDKFASGKMDTVLKTDLFDEAINKGLYPKIAMYSKQVTGIDISPLAVSLASENYPFLNAQCGDIRNLCFANGSFDFIVSNSTIDHFGCQDDIVQSLGELYRVLSDDGAMFISMDNLANPVIWLRNMLSKINNQKLKISPYYVGETLTPWSFKKHLINAGFIIDAFTICMNFPRILLILFENHLEKIFERENILRFCKKFEVLSKTPFSYFTGYFIVAKVSKR